MTHLFDRNMFSVSLVVAVVAAAMLFFQMLLFRNALPNWREMSDRRTEKRRKLSESSL